MRHTLLLLTGMQAACSGRAPIHEQARKDDKAVEPKTAEPKMAGPKTAGPKTAETPAPPSDLPEGEDIMAKVLAMNGDTARPPVKFRKGHVSPRKPPQVKKTATGFEVKFASGAPVVTPAVHGGKVFASGGFHSKEFHAFDAKTGEPSWSVNLDDDGPSSPACERGICVFNTESCTVFALDAETGRMRWSWWLGDPLTSAPTISGGRVFVSYPTAQTADGKPRPADATHVLIALDLESGAILWQKWLDSDVMSAPVAQGEFLYAATFAGSLLKLEQKTGTFRYAIKARATSAPVVQFAAGRESMFYTRRGDKEADGAEEMIIRADDNSPKTTFRAKSKKAQYLDEKVQGGSKYNDESAAQDASNGFSGATAPAASNAAAAAKTVGRNRVSSMQAFQGSRILNLGKANVNTMGDEVVATNADSGDTLWSYKLKGDLADSGGSLGTAPLSAGKSVLFATLEGEVVELDPASGGEKGRYKVGRPVRSQPVVVDGWIYVGTQDGRLVAIDTGKAELTGWSMWGGNAARTGIASAAAP